MKINRVRLIACMTERGLSLSQLSELCGLSACTISLIRSGKTCSQKSAEALAQALDVSLETLMKEVSINAS